MSASQGFGCGFENASGPCEHFHTFEIPGSFFNPDSIVIIASVELETRALPVLARQDSEKCGVIRHCELKFQVSLRID